jgi:hypothetical protein
LNLRRKRFKYERGALNHDYEQMEDVSGLARGLLPDHFGGVQQKGKY